MGYLESLRVSSEWLAKIQNTDGGWGLAPSQASSLVNTAEALFVLSKAKSHHDAIHRGLSFIEQNLFGHIKSRGARIRYVALPLLTVSSCFPLWRTDFQATMAAWLSDAQNDDGAWGVEANDSRSDLFSTYLAVIALSTCSAPRLRSKNTTHWILSRGSSRGWLLHTESNSSNEQRISFVGTAYALLALTALHETGHEFVQRGKEILLQIDHWGHEEETIAGTVWRHCTYTHVIQALVILKTDPFSKTVAEGVRHANRLTAVNSGWKESEFDGNPTVRSQYWAVSAFDAILQTVDPAIQVPRIDAERTEGTLREPDFVKFFIHTKVAMILPTRVYVWFVYLLLFASGFLLLDFLALLPSIPSDIIGIFFLATAWVLIEKRPTKFRRLARLGTRVVAVLGAINLLFGPSLYSLWSSAKSFLQNLF